MIDLEPVRVQVIAHLTREGGARCGQAARDIEKIADERMPGRGQVDADLVRPAGGDRGLDQRLAVPPFQHAHVE
jgi:hypothetical protein